MAMLAPAITLPTNSVVTPAVKEVPKLHHTAHASGFRKPGALVRVTLAPGARVSAVWEMKIHTPLGCDAPGRTRGPDTRNSVAQYTPGTRDRPDSSVAAPPGNWWEQCRERSLLLALLASFFAFFAAPSLLCSAAPGPRVTRPGPKPVMVVPGDTPTLLVMDAGLPLDTEVPASTEKEKAVPRAGADAPAETVAKGRHDPRATMTRATHGVRLGARRGPDPSTSLGSGSGCQWFLVMPACKVEVAVGQPDSTQANFSLGAESWTTVNI
jgi:hypothetical protein